MCEESLDCFVGGWVREFLIRRGKDVPCSVFVLKVEFSGYLVMVDVVSELVTSVMKVGCWMFR